ncbi:flagella synthesis protein FlgN [Polaromonas sp. OV174]|uniref:flagella synthesis protein FlgN n=1 Tax=Polaromonas sp. OV174 TaxID=1855300 RepID=UPI0008EB4F6A|nr:flagellar protein FlgN [Polaromonas sp. OV174]SFC68069.1 flagella synthesis protein FlgN [Polaromonas sp. OV174]
MSQLLLNHLTREHAAIGDFLELLDQEAEAMTHGDFAKLPGLVDRKSRLADQITFFSRQREIEQETLGYPAGRSGAEAVVAAGGEAMQKAWRDLRDLAAQAHERNHRNGVMIHTHLDYTRQAISFLHAKTQPLYGPNGTHHTGASTGKPLALG